MKILMIGNGFDLEHGLPTKYTDFLDYIITFRGYYARVYQGQVKPRCDADKGDYFEKLFSDKKNHYKVEALQAMEKDNLWIDYFIKVREQHLKNKENWIDFESEISRIVQDLDEFQKIAGSSSWTEEYYHYKEKLREILEQEDLTPEVIPKTIDKLMLELNKLICALEIYLDDYVGGKEIILYNPDIAQIHPDNVISFNYTDTFRKVYGEYDTNTLPSFVHGMATDHTDRFRVRLRKKGDKNANRVERIIEKNNMVLGIDEYLPENRRAAEIDFIEFKKFYQRIYKGTGNEYKKWLLANEPKMLYIFGHSLDVTDGDLLREFLERDDVKTVVFYLDNKQRRQLITNLVKILGEDAVIEKTYGNNPSIVFQKQSPAEKIENSKFERMICTILRFLWWKRLAVNRSNLTRKIGAAVNTMARLDRMQIRQRLLKKLIHLTGFIKMRTNKSIQMRKMIYFQNMSIFFTVMERFGNRHLKGYGKISERHVPKGHIARRNCGISCVRLF